MPSLRRERRDLRSTVGRVMKVAEEARRRAAVFATMAVTAIIITVAVTFAYWLSQVLV